VDARFCHACAISSTPDEWLDSTAAPKHLIGRRLGLTRTALLTHSGRADARTAVLPISTCRKTSSTSSDGSSHWPRANLRAVELPAHEPGAGPSTRDYGALSGHATGLRCATSGQSRKWPSGGPTILSLAVPRVDLKLVDSEREAAVGIEAAGTCGGGGVDSTSRRRHQFVGSALGGGPEALFNLRRPARSD
jgi:hypothetical protein